MGAIRQVNRMMTISGRRYSEIRNKSNSSWSQSRDDFVDAHFATSLGRFLRFAALGIKCSEKPYTHEDHELPSSGMTAAW